MAFPASKPTSNRLVRSASSIPLSLALEQNVVLGHRRVQRESSTQTGVIEALPLRGTALVGRLLWSSHQTICGLIAVCSLRASCKGRRAYMRPGWYLVRYGEIPDGTRKLLAQTQLFSNPESP
ncbi:MAG: hypothetical protein RL069_269, partial [Planctomycetota bacterium]